MNRRRGRTTIVGVLVLTVLVVGGCNSDPDPVVTPSPSPTPTETAAPSPSPSPTELTDEELLEALPSDAHAQTFFGSIHFSRFFVELYPELFRDPQAVLLFATLSAPGCGFCASSLDAARAAGNDGVLLEGGGFTWGDVLETAQGGYAEDGYWYLEQRVTVGESSTFDSSGEEVGSAPGGDAVYTSKLEWNGQHWMMVGANLEFDDA